MDFNNLFTPLKERVRSPIYVSFIVSWILWNWRIVFTIVFPNRQNFENKTLIEFIEDKYINYWDILWWPLIIGTGVVIFLPLFDWGILLFTERIKRGKINTKITIGRRNFVEGNIYYDLQLKFNKELQNILNLETDINKLEASYAELDSTKNSEIRALQENNDVLSRSLQQAEKHHNDLRSKYEALSKRNDLEGNFIGRWTAVISDRDTYISKQEEWNITHPNRDISIIDKNKEIDLGRIIWADYDWQWKSFRFVLFDVKKKTPIAVYNLRIIRKDRFEGEINDGEKMITLEKVGLR